MYDGPPGKNERDFDIMELRLQQVNHQGSATWLLHCTTADTDAYWSMAEQAGPKKFASAERARAFAENLGYKLSLGELPTVELDEVLNLGEHPRPVSADTLYHAWNFFGDLARTLGLSFRGFGEEGLAVQEEIFWSTSVAGYSGEPDFTHRQTETLAEVVREGLARWTPVHAPAVERVPIPA